MSSTKQSVEDEQYGLLIRSLDWAAWGAETVGIPLGYLDSDHMVASAIRSTGLSDFGEPGWRYRLDFAVEAAKRAPLTALGRVALRQFFVLALCNRLKLHKRLADLPQIRDVKVERPIFVLGFPRTGTTLLQNLLQLHPNRRSLQFWELSAPVPEYDDPAVDEAWRVKSAGRNVAAAKFLAPEMQEIHAIGARTAEECWPLFATSFSVMNWDLQTGLGEWGKWLLQQDMVYAYNNYKLHLQSLLYERPAKHLVLKCPEHLWFLDSLLEVFPDACIVWTHRDPLDSVASYSSLISLGWRMWYGRFHPSQVGVHTADRFHEGVTRAMAVRDKVGDDRFYDTNFDVVVRDPGRTVRNICDTFDLEPPSEERMEAYHAKKREDARGKHLYSHERFGVDADDIYERFGPYIDRFKINVRAKDKAPTPVFAPSR